MSAGEALIEEYVAWDNQHTSLWKSISTSSGEGSAMVERALPGAARLPVPLIRGQQQRSWPRYTDAKRVPYAPLAMALSERYPYDAHTAAYSVPSLPYRLSSGALLPEHKSQLPDGVAMVLAVFDIDCPGSHRASGGSGEVASEAWWRVELGKVEALAQTHAGAYAYRSRGGYRLVYRLAEPHILRDLMDREVWSARYLAWCAYLKRAFDIAVDPSCKDWTRLYRLPHATREPGRGSEEWQTWGDPRRVGVWQYVPIAEDVALAQMLSRRKVAADVSQRNSRNSDSTSHGAGEGILYHAFRARGWLGEAIEDGKWAVQCPWEASHSKGEPYDTSTIIFAPGSGDVTGWFHCSHAHCQHRDLRNVLTLFTPVELDRAREAAGLITYTAKGLRLSHIGRRVRTIPAKEVLAWRG